MLILGKPKDLKKYIIIIDKTINGALQKEGFIPKYKADGMFYYKKSEKLQDFLARR